MKSILIRLIYTDWDLNRTEALLIWIVGLVVWNVLCRPVVLGDEYDLAMNMINGGGRLR